MRQISLLLFGLTTNLLCFSQITGNSNVKDVNAVILDSVAISKLQGQWSCVSYVENIKDDIRTNTEPHIILELKSDKTYIEKRCKDCRFFKDGNWDVLPNNTFKFAVNTRHKQSGNKLEGIWVIHKLTDKELMMVRILTSTGDWKKEIRFKR